MAKTPEIMNVSIFSLGLTDVTEPAKTKVSAINNIAGKDYVTFEIEPTVNVLFEEGVQDLREGTEVDLIPDTTPGVYSVQFKQVAKPKSAVTKKSSPSKGFNLVSSIRDL